MSFSSTKLLDYKGQDIKWNQCPNKNPARYREISEISKVQFQSSDYFSETRYGIIYRTVFDQEFSRIFIIPGGDQFKQRIYNKLNSLKGLKKGWDGFNAEPIPSRLIGMVYEQVVNFDYEPEIYPTARNSLQLEFDHANKSMEIEIFEHKIVYYFVNDETGEEKEWEEKELGRINNHLRQFIYNS